MSYILVQAVNRNLKRSNGKYSNILKDIDAEYGWADNYFFKQSSRSKK